MDPFADDPNEIDPPSGSRVGPYIIVSPLGEGGMGRVFLGNDPRLHRMVALKCLLSGRSAGDSERSRILREARAAARINHSNVAAIHDIVDDGTRAFIVMEYVEGETLASRLRRGTLPPTEVTTMGRQLAGALAAAHQRSVIHRDLKPANIQVKPDGSVKILDSNSANRPIRFSRPPMTLVRKTTAIVPHGR